MKIQLDSVQSEAIDEIIDWYDKDKKQTFFLNGTAGTGKTTIMEYLIKKLNIGYDSIRVVSFTGQAASVLSKKLNSNGVTITGETIHKLVYFPKVRKVKTRAKVDPKILASESLEEKKERIKREIKVSKADSKNRLSFSKKPEDKLDGVELVIVDEATMLSKRIRDDLLSYGTMVLYVGDLAQLPSFNKSGKTVSAIEVLGDPDFNLDKVYRQGEGSQIINLSDKVKNKEPLELGVYGDNSEVSVVSMSHFNQDVQYKVGVYTHADQIICGKNATRKQINGDIRIMNNITDKLPVVGEKLICMKNSQSVWFDESTPLVNGMQCEVIDVLEINHYSMIIELKPIDKYYDYESRYIEIATAPFTNPNFDNSSMFNSNFEFFDFGYAITCHKSQGSQWENVLVINERLSRDTHHKWLYTAITRAEKRLIIVN